jgi:luciferase-like monooxygenase
MFGRWGYFVGPRLFACFPLRAKDADLWIRLSREDQRRAIDSGVVTPHRRMSGRGWVETRVESLGHAARALDWLKRSYETAKHIVEQEERR